MKELIKKILREEVQKRFTKSNQNFERLIIKQMESLISETNRVIVPPDDYYGNYSEDWCKGNKIIMEARYFFKFRCGLTIFNCASYQFKLAINKMKILIEDIK